MGYILWTKEPQRNLKLYPVILLLEVILIFLNYFVYNIELGNKRINVLKDHNFPREKPYKSKAKKFNQNSIILHLN